MDYLQLYFKKSAVLHVLQPLPLPKWDKVLISLGKALNGLKCPLIMQIRALKYYTICNMSLTISDLRPSRKWNDEVTAIPNRFHSITLLLPSSSQS